MAVVDKKPLIFEAIPKVIADVGAVGKDKVNKVQGFKYRSIDDVFNALNPALAKNGVFIVPLTLSRTVTECGKTSKGATVVKVVLKMKFTFYAADGSHVEAIVFGEAMDMADKATNKAMSIAYKYACFQIFCIPTEEMQDPDANSPAEDLVSTPQRITADMLQTVRDEQIRTGVKDSQILSLPSVTSKKVADMTVDEFRAVMQVFKNTKTKE